MKVEITKFRLLRFILKKKKQTVQTNIFLSPFRLVARFGEYDIYSTKDCVRGVCADPIVRIKVAAIMMHPGYVDKTHDIAILRLEEDAPYTGMYFNFLK